jgi:hypothetical protein
VASVLKIKGPNGDKDVVLFNEVNDEERQRPERVIIPYFL